MRAIFLLLTFLLTLTVQAQVIRAECPMYQNIKRIDSILSCNNRNMLFVYVNGVNSNREVSHEALDRLLSLNQLGLLNPSQAPIANQDPNKKYTKIEPTLSYNYSFTETMGNEGTYIDVVEASAHVFASLAQAQEADVQRAQIEAQAQSERARIEQEHQKVEEVRRQT